MAEGYLANIKFLVVEDNSFMQTVIRRVLAALGAREVRECNDGADALKILQTFAADIIITDWAMDPIDGIELTQMIRAAPDSLNPYVPITMLSAYSELNRIVQARDSGVNEFVVKPVSVNALFNRIEAVTEKPRAFIRAKDFFGPDRRRRVVSFTDPGRRTVSTTLPDGVGSNELELNQDEVN